MPYAGLLLAAMLMIGTLPALAQPSIDAQSRSERLGSEINSSIQRQQQNLRQLQQNQFEINQMRGEQERLRNTPAPPQPVVPVR